MGIGPVVTSFIVGTEGGDLRHEEMLKDVRNDIRKYIKSRSAEMHIVVTQVQSHKENGSTYLFFWVCTASNDHSIQSAVSDARAIAESHTGVLVGGLRAKRQPTLREQFSPEKKA